MCVAANVADDEKGKKRWNAQERERSRARRKCTEVRAVVTKSHKQRKQGKWPAEDGGGRCRKP